ncbi:hypothetical protein ACJMK2_006090 [Sinanodonta woodiana]|uniref:L-Fucosyltransferase n=1 Tax=Sinanodonta woodiana TaxID=1069815 RepID=A0ABD3VS33_SINWO
MIHTTNYGYYIGGGDVGISSSSIIVAGPFLCSANKGRLGNLMFEFASLTGIAALNNRTLIVGTGDYIYKVFDLKNVTVLDNRDVCNTFEVIEETLGCCKFDSTLMTLPRGKSFKIGLYLQSWKYFQLVQDEIRRQYQFRDHIKEKARYLVNKIRASYVYKSPKLIGIHVRIGDIANEMHNYRGLVIAPEGYIYKAMDYTKARFSDIIFVVASDDLKWSRSVLSSRANDSIYFLEEGMPPEVDLAVLASCDHVIQTVGTFSWWAGFLSGGLSIYYPHPGRIGSPGEARYNYADFFLPNWIPIDV